MYEKLSKRVEAVIRLARDVARADDQEYLGTEHVLLAICREGTGVGAKMLDAFQVDETKLRQQIDILVRKSLDETLVFGNLPGSPHLKSVVATSIRLAQQLESREVCTEHLLLAMFGEKGSVAETVLRNLGMTYDAARAKAVELTAA